MDSDDAHALKMLVLSGKFSVHSAQRVLADETFRYQALYPTEHPTAIAITKKQAADQRRRYRANKHKKRRGEAQGWRCRYCDADVSGPRMASVDHTIPLARGGSDEYENTQIVCRACNSSKGDRTDEEYREMLGAVSVRLGVAPQDVRERRKAERLLWECDCHHYGCEPVCIGCALCAHNHKSFTSILCWEQTGEEAMSANEHGMPVNCDKPAACMGKRRCLNSHTTIPSD